MLTRRLILAAALALPAAAALSQDGKKSASADPFAASGVSVAGSYAAEGRNPDGSAYSGQVTIRQDGTRVSMDWRIGTDTYSGDGVVEGRVVTVDWGAETPVVYVVMPDGDLHGTWDDGRGLEKLTRN